jgi:hypothetical protein
MSYHAPVAARVRSMYDSTSSNLATRLTQELLVTSEWQPSWMERRIKNCTVNVSVCAAINCTVNVTANCSYALGFSSSWDNRYAIDSRSLLAMS